MIEVDYNEKDEVFNRIGSIEEGMMDNQSDLRDLACEYTFPYMVGQNIRYDQYDNTARISIMKLSARATKYSFTSEELPIELVSTDDLTSHRTAFNQATKKLFRNIHRTNVYTALYNANLDGFVRGTGNVGIRFDPLANKLVHKHIPFSEMKWEINDHGLIDTNLRVWEQRKRDIVARWPNLINHGDFNDFSLMNEKVELKRIAFPAIPNSNALGFHIYVMYGDEVVARYKNYPFNDIMTYNIDYNSESVYGTSPAMNSVPIMLMIDAIARTIVIGSELRAEPPVFFPAEYLTKLMEQLQHSDLKGKLVPYSAEAAVGASTPPQPFTLRYEGNWQSSMQDLEMLKRMVKEELKDRDPPPPGQDPNGRETATYHNIQRKIFFEDMEHLGINLEKQVQELTESSLRALIMHGIDVDLQCPLAQAWPNFTGPQIPPNIFVHGNKQVEIEVITGLQKGIREQEGLKKMQLIQQLLPTAQAIGPEAVARFRFANELVEAGKLMGWPDEDGIISEEEAQEKVQEMMAQQLAQQGQQSETE